VYTFKEEGFLLVCAGTLASHLMYKIECAYAYVVQLASLFSHTVGQCWRTSEVMLPLVEVATILWHVETIVLGIKGLVN
jgi:hypothetical protein